MTVRIAMTAGTIGIAAGVAATGVIAATMDGIDGTTMVPPGSGGRL